MEINERQDTEAGKLEKGKKKKGLLTLSPNIYEIFDDNVR